MPSQFDRSAMTPHARANLVGDKTTTSFPLVHVSRPRPVSACEALPHDHERRLSRLVDRVRLAGPRDDWDRRRLIVRRWRGM